MFKKNIIAYKRLSYMHLGATTSANLTKALFYLDIIFSSVEKKQQFCLD